MTDFGAHEESGENKVITATVSKGCTLILNHGMAGDKQVPFSSIRGHRQSKGPGSLSSAHRGTRSNQQPAQCWEVTLCLWGCPSWGAAPSLVRLNFPDCSSASFSFPFSHHHSDSVSSFLLLSGRFHLLNSKLFLLHAYKYSGSFLGYKWELGFFFLLFPFYLLLVFLLFFFMCVLTI